jgi:preprotein translocase subunit SecG
VSILSNIVLFLAIIVAVVFSLLVLITGKGDAMSGGGSVRTSYKGKATFDDIMSQAALYLGVSFMVLVLLYNVVSARALHASSSTSAPISAPSTNVPAANIPLNNTPANNNAPASASNQPATNVPATNSPAANTPETKAPATNTPATNAPTTSNNAPK